MALKAYMRFGIEISIRIISKLFEKKKSNVFNWSDEKCAHLTECKKTVSLDVDDGDTNTHMEKHHLAGPKA